VLSNALDGSEQVYRLKGVGDAPVAMEHIVIECEARKKYVSLSMTFSQLTSC
jgi:hypothetical protein